MAEPDELYTLRNRFWLGNFSMAIAEGNQLSRLSDVLAVERDEFVYRSYIGLGQYGLVISEVDEESAMPLQAVKLLAQYLEDPASTKDMVIMTLGEWLGDAASKDHPTVQLVAALVYEKEDLMKEAFTAIRHGQTMEQLALWAQFCLKIHRLDLAQAHLKKLSDADEDATLTQLVSGWVNLATGGEKYKEAAYAFEELIDKFEATLSLLNSLAVCKMHLREWDEAEKLLLQAQSKNVNDADTLINMVTCYAHMGKDEQVRVDGVHGPRELARRRREREERRRRRPHGRERQAVPGEAEAVRVREALRGGLGVLRVRARVAHAHEDDGPQRRQVRHAPRRAQREPELRGDLVVRERPNQAHLARRAESAAHGAADLGRHAQRRRRLAARELRDEHGLDGVAVAELHEELRRPVLGGPRVRAARVRARAVGRRQRLARPPRQLGRLLLDARVPALAQRLPHGARPRLADEAPQRLHGRRQEARRS